MFKTLTQRRISTPPPIRRFSWLSYHFEQKLILKTMTGRTHNESHPLCNISICNPTWRMELIITGQIIITSRKFLIKFTIITKFTLGLKYVYNVIYIISKAGTYIYYRWGWGLGLGWTLPLLSFFETSKIKLLFWFPKTFWIGQSPPGNIKKDIVFPTWWGLARRHSKIILITNISSADL